MHRNTTAAVRGSSWGSRCSIRGCRAHLLASHNLESHAAPLHPRLLHALLQVRGCGTGRQEA
jgi:hypothetical protein